MTLYNVHIYREMRITFGGIEAETPEAAASIASGRPTSDADDIEDCDGADLAALVDVAGDEEFSQSVTIDFEPERHRRAASALLEALESLLSQTADMDLAHGITLTEGEREARDKALAAIAAARSAGITPAPATIDINALLSQRRQIADVWTVEDVQTVRPELNDEQAWAVLQRAQRHFDAAIGLHWDVLASHAEMLFAETPETDEDAAGEA
jgi:hypothetical protein